MPKFAILNHENIIQNIIVADHKDDADTAVGASTIQLDGELDKTAKIGLILQDGVLSEVVVPVEE